MHDAVLVRARSGRCQEDIGLAPLVIGSRAFAVYPPELAEPVSRALATSLALFWRKLSVPGELMPSLALFRRKLSRESIAFPFPFPRTLLRGRVQPCRLLSLAVVCTLLRGRIQTRGLLSLAVVCTLLFALF
jgi:hypothetical protein